MREALRQDPSGLTEYDQAYRDVQRTGSMLEPTSGGLLTMLITVLPTRP